MMNYPSAKIESSHCRLSLKEVGSWKLEDGRWKLEDGSWKMDVGRWMLEDGCWRMDVGGSLLESRIIKEVLGNEEIASSLRFSQ
jgi:hypothetical protein